MGKVIRRGHRIIGAILVLPFLGWAVTGLIFFIKPGYGDAYAQLKPKTYPLKLDQLPVPDPNWLECRLVTTTLGNHLLVATQEGPQHLRLETGESWPLPQAAELRRLIEDAIATRPDRYGSIASVEGALITTSTGVTINLNWPNLSLYQSGPDTRRIDRLYKIHYLQWSGSAGFDRFLGIAGLLLLMVMTGSGVYLLIRSGI